MITRLTTRAMVEVVVPFGFSKAGFLSGCPVELGVVAASKEGEDQGELFVEQFSLGENTFFPNCPLLLIKNWEPSL